MKIRFLYLRYSLTFARIRFFHQLLLSGTTWILTFAMEIVSTFLQIFLQFKRPTSNRFYDCHYPKEIKIVPRLHTGLSHLRDHKFKDSFQGSLNPICGCGINVESCLHFSLHCLSLAIFPLILIQTHLF